MVLKNGSVKVTDFGIARVMSKSNTLTKEALGSVHYISPEQAKGGWVDNRSDLYSLSVVMYEMMTGRPPYDGESPVAVAIQHINGNPVMPSTLNPNIPVGLEQIIMKGMALEAKDRYASATEMLRDMDEFRKDPMISFAPAQEVAEPTRKLDTQEVLREAKRARTTAEKVAGTAAGAAGAAAAAKARAAGEQRRQAAETANSRTVAQAQQRTSVPTQVHTMNTSPRRTREQIREEIREEERNRMATIAVVVCSAVAIIAIIIFLVLLVNGVLFNKGDTTVTVPNLEGEPYKNIQQIEGLEIAVGDYKHHDTIAKDKVISQTPAYGATVVQGTKVTVVLSLGPEPEVKVLDNLTFMAQEEAKAYLDRLGVNVLIKWEFNDTVKKGSVIRTDPAANTELEDGQTVWLICSSGPVIEMAEMPELVGMSYEKAKELLSSLGFSDSNISYVRRDSDADKDEVIKQPYLRGTMVDVTEEIVLTISKGPKETEPATEATEKPTEKPTEAPKETQPAEVTKTVTIELPADRTEDYVLGLFFNGKSVLEDTAITAGTRSIDVTLTGAGTVYYDLYINNTYYTAVKVEFS
jgi:serine/threonine-protein kinase